MPVKPVETEKTREIAHVRIHVERVIGSLRQKYTILAGILPIHVLLQVDVDVAILDKTVTICCALIYVRLSFLWTSSWPVV